MDQPSPSQRVLAAAVVLPILSVEAASASDYDEFRVKREPVFEFARKPEATRRGDNVTITFVSKAFCDATVAIEDATGRIVRHLGSGVLGPNAPEPFQKNSLKQTMTWDGKDDRGEGDQPGEGVGELVLRPPDR